MLSHFYSGYRITFDYNEIECMSTQLSPQTVWLAEEQGEGASRCLVQIINEVKIEEL